ncbi:hypothetical protein N665_0103s0040 [Sinapis alba]|nr:hypothetical protein N665_0103s0040 [Sinapis alba]
MCLEDPDFVEVKEIIRKFGLLYTVLDVRPYAPHVIQEFYSNLLHLDFRNGTNLVYVREKCSTSLQLLSLRYSRLKVNLRRDLGHPCSRNKGTSLPSLFFLSLDIFTPPIKISSPIRRCSLKGKAIASDSESESTGSLLIRRPRAITLRRMDNPRPTTADSASLDDNKRDENELQPEQPISADVDSVNKDKSSVEKEVKFTLADFLPMRWTRTDLEFDEEIDLEQERTLSAKKKQNWVNHFPTKSTFKTVRRLIFQTNPPAGFSFLIPAEHQSPWTPPSGYACVYESWFINSSVWWPLPEFLTTYCFRRKIALGQYTTNGIRIMVTLTVLAAELGIRMSVHLHDTKYHREDGILLRKDDPQVQRDHREAVESELLEPPLLLHPLSKWSQGGSQSFLEEVEAIRTLSHQHWQYISEARIQAALNRINRVEIPSKIPSRNRHHRMGKLNLSALPSYADTIGTPEHGRGSADVSRPAKRRRDSSIRVEPSHGGQNLSLEENPPTDPVSEAGLIMATEMPMEEHPVDPSIEERSQGDQRQEPAPASCDGEVVEYPHVIDFKYRSIDVPFIEDHEAPACLFHQIKLKKRGMSELDQLHQDSRYREMTRASAKFFGNANLMVRDYEVKLRAQEASLAAKAGSLKKKRKEIAELAYKCSSYEGQIEALVPEKSKALEKAEFERYRNELLSAELEALKAQKELLDSRCFSLEQEKSELSLHFETTTMRLRESREHEVRKERSRVESTLRQQVMPIYEKMGQFIGEQTKIQSKLALYSQAKGTREGLEKIQSQGLSMDEVLQKAKTGEAHFLEELQKMEIVDTSEINLLLIGLDEHGSNMKIFSPQDIEDLRS